MTVLVNLASHVARLLESDDGGVVTIVEVLAGVPVRVERCDVQADHSGAVAGGRSITRWVARVGA